MHIALFCVPPGSDVRMLIIILREICIEFLTGSEIIMT